MDKHEPRALDEGSLSSRPSKTKRKKDSHALQKLGTALAALSEARLEKLPIDEALRDALLAAPTIRSHEGRRRHMQYVGKLMRRIDPAPLEEALAQEQLGSAKASLALHEAERWRSELIQNDAALTSWMNSFPDTNVTEFRALIRDARMEASAPDQRSGKSFRALFQWIKQAQVGQSQPRGGDLGEGDPES